MNIICADHEVDNFIVVLGV